MTNQPNLFLIGAMKSGTTTLHELLAQHPAVSMSEPKEPCYFVASDQLKVLWPEMWRMGFWKDESSYLALFQNKPQARYFGESSTDYSKRPGVEGVVERIAAFNPDARFIYIMRDPIERTLSHYWHMVEHRGEMRPPLQAIRQDAHYTEVSHYAYQLQPYIERFGRDRVYALTFEEIKRDPQSVMRAVFDWLGVDSDFVPQSLTAARNVTPEGVRQRRAGMGVLNALRHSAIWNAVGHYCPPALRRYGVAMVERTIPRRDVDMTDVVAHLRPVQQAQTRELEAQLGRTFDEWKTLWGQAT